MLNKLTKRLDKYQNDMRDIERIKNNPRLQYDFISVGSGPTLYDIDYSCFDGQGLNLGQAPQTLHYSKLLLEEYEALFAPNAIIIIIMCPFFFGNNAAVKGKYYSNKYYYLLSEERRKKILNYSSFKAFGADHNLPFILYGIGLKTNLKKLFKRRKVKETIIKKTIPEDALRMAEIWKNEFNLSNFNDVSQYSAHEETANEKLKTLLDLINYLQAKSFRPVCVVPPISSPINNLFSKEFIDLFFFDNLEKIKNDGVTILDYHDVGFSDNLFKTSIFLNADGAQKFSSTLFNDIGEVYK